MWTAEELVAEATERLAALEVTDSRPKRVISVTVRTLRFYRRAGVVTDPEKRRGKNWLYDGRHLAQLVAIRRLQGLGMELDQIRHVLRVAEDRGILKRLADLGRDLDEGGFLHGLEEEIAVAHPGDATATRAGADDPGRQTDGELLARRIIPGVCLVIEPRRLPGLNPKQLDAARKKIEDILEAQARERTGR